MSQFIKLFIFSFTFYCSFTYSQEKYLYIGTNKYPASEYLAFKESADFHDGRIYVRFAISPNGAFLELKKSYPSIKGPIKIFLESGNFIMCNDYGIYDEIDNSDYMTIYKLTDDEFKHLAVENIDKIRYEEKGSGIFALSKYVYMKENYGGYNNPRERVEVNLETAKFIKSFQDNQSEIVTNHDYNALINAVPDRKITQTISTITLTPNYVETGRKTGNISVPSLSGQINSMTIYFDKKIVKVKDAIEEIVFNIVKYEWMEGNKLWVDFSSRPQEFYMVIIFDMDGLIFINNENDPQPGEEYKSLYFKELNISDFLKIYPK